MKDEIFVKSARHCCVCHKPKGLNIEVHHITPKMQGGKDTFENAIALCFDCHADAGHYFAGHPKGAKLSSKELKDRNKPSSYYIPFVNKISSYDEYIDYLNGDFPEKNYLQTPDEDSNTDCQPIKHLMPNILFAWGPLKADNLNHIIYGFKLIQYNELLII
ncbi:HNH endonuclease [Mariniflexile sp. HMF6888]|uniref:HNH endonuclease n=1 Tax=Mariniflexile sp. HMF6888 TaxID=3373086 RepID=UPI0037B3E252